MSERRLPVRPNLDQLKHQAKDLLRSIRKGDASWRDDVETVRELVRQNPKLLHENAGIRNDNWGPPLSYAANLGRDEIIKLLHKFGAIDLEHAMGRAMLQSKISTAAMLYKLQIGRAYV